MYAKTYIQSGKIISRGSNGYSGGNENRAGGGASGGGSINIFSYNPIIKGVAGVSGGIGGKADYIGGKGGDGCVTIGNISTGTFIADV